MVSATNMAFRRSNSMFGDEDDGISLASMNQFATMPFEDLRAHMDPVHRSLQAPSLFDGHSQLMRRHQELCEHAQDMFQHAREMHRQAYHMAQRAQATMDARLEVAFPGMFSPPPSFPPPPPPSFTPPRPGSRSRIPQDSYETFLALDDDNVRRGIAHSDRAKLKRVAASYRDQAKQCGICQENFVVGGKMIILPCSHSFCDKELLTWLDENKTCPTCRFVVENVRYR